MKKKMGRVLVKGSTAKKARSKSLKAWSPNGLIEVNKKAMEQGENFSYSMSFLNTVFQGNRAHVLAAITSAPIDYLPKWMINQVTVGIMMHHKTSLDALIDAFPATRPEILGNMVEHFALDGHLYWESALSSNWTVTADFLDLKSFPHAFERSVKHLMRYGIEEDSTALIDNWVTSVPKLQDPNYSRPPANMPPVGMSLEEWVNHPNCALPGYEVVNGPKTIDDFVELRRTGASIDISVSQSWGRKTVTLEGDAAAFVAGMMIVPLNFMPNRLVEIYRVGIAAQFSGNLSGFRNCVCLLSPEAISNAMTTLIKHGLIKSTSGTTWEEDLDFTDFEDVPESGKVQRDLIMSVSNSFEDETLFRDAFSQSVAKVKTV